MKVSKSEKRERKKIVITPVGNRSKKFADQGIEKNFSSYDQENFMEVYSISRYRKN